MSSETRKKYKSKILYFILAIMFGFFMFVVGGIDDSPGLQLLGVITVIVGLKGWITGRIGFRKNDT